jgi:hypothetical protein
MGLLVLLMKKSFDLSFVQNMSIDKYDSKQQLE